jgi:hypothetical protein
MFAIFLGNRQCFFPIATLLVNRFGTPNVMDGIAVTLIGLSVAIIVGPVLGWWFELFFLFCENVAKIIRFDTNFYFGSFFSFPNYLNS